MLELLQVILCINFLFGGIMELHFNIQDTVLSILVWFHSLLCAGNSAGAVSTEKLYSVNLLSFYDRLPFANENTAMHVKYG